MPDSSTEPAEAASVHSTLKTGLKKRHLTMLSMGGVIGAGFFVGLSGIINQAGPGAVITCAICGIIVFLVMRMLGEMAVAKPCTGSFTELSTAIVSSPLAAIYGAFCGHGFSPRTAR
nr:hypothetical protein [Rhodococcus erythropolis]